MSPDANGYVVQARLLATTGHNSFKTASPASFVGIHWLEARDNVYYSRYPAGLPLLFALAWRLFGYTGALLVNPVLASGTVFLVFLLARRIAGQWPALLAAAVVAAAPIANEHALCADAHTATGFLMVAATIALLHAVEASAVWAVIGALCLGLIPTIRYPEILATGWGLAWFGWVALRRGRASSLIPAYAVAAIPTLLLCINNQRAFGAFWRTGYALTNEQTAFSVEYLKLHFLPYVHSLGGAGLGIFFGLGAIGLTAMCFDRKERDAGLLLAGLCAPLVGLYMSYYFSSGDGSMRFLVPEFPLFAVAGTWLLVRAAAALGSAAPALWWSAAALQLVVGTVESTQLLDITQTSLVAATKVRRAAEKQLPDGGVIVASRPIADSLDGVGRWHLVEEGLVASIATTRPPARRPDAAPDKGAKPGNTPPRAAAPHGDASAASAPAAVQPSPEQPNKNQAQQARYGTLSPEQKREQLWADIEKWADGHPIVWLARSVNTVRSTLPAGAECEDLGELDSPALAGLGGGPRNDMGFAQQALFMLMGTAPPPGAGQPANHATPKLHVMRIALKA